MLRNLSTLGVILALGGCAKPYGTPWVVAYPEGYRPSPQDHYAVIQEQQRIARFRDLATAQGVFPPDVQQTLVSPGAGASGPVPVLRMVFPERAFFAFDSAVPLQGSEQIFNLIAASMTRDEPDVALTVLGHTDAIGTDAYNIALSSRRAAAVMTALVARGVDANELSEVAIGMHQPIAPNDTPEGRALNRRVEILISPSIAANLAAVQQYVAPETYFHVGPEPQPRTRLPATANVYQLRPRITVRQTTKPSDEILRPVGGIALGPLGRETVESAPLGSSTAQTSPVRAVHLAPALPITPVQMVPITPVRPRDVAPAGSGPDSY